MSGIYTQQETYGELVRNLVLSIPGNIDATAVDNNNTGQTHILRRGLGMANLTTGGQFVDWDDDAADGSQVGTGILLDDVDLKDGDPSATATDHLGHILVMGSVMQANVIVDSAGAIANFVSDLAGKIWFL